MTLAELAPYPSITRHVSAPEGTVWVTVCLGPGHVWIDASAGKAGSQAQAAAHSIAALAGIAIRHGADPVYVALALRGVTHDRSNGARQEALSIPDAIGLVLWEFVT